MKRSNRSKLVRKNKTNKKIKTCKTCYWYSVCQYAELQGRIKRKDYSCWVEDK